MSDTQINLIKKDIEIETRVSYIEDMIRAAAMWAMGAVLVAGVLVAGLFFYYQYAVQGGEVAKATLIRDINTHKIKEGLLISLNGRLGIAKKALDATKPWGALFPLMTRIAPENWFSSLSIDETGKVTISLELPSVNDAVNVVTQVIILSKERLLKIPMMSGFSLREDGKVYMLLSFYPIFTL